MPPSTSRYDRLDAVSVASTLDALVVRMVARFPDRGLTAVAADLRHLADEVAAESSTHRRQVRRARAACGVVAVLVAAVATIAVALAVRDALRLAEGTPAFEWLPVVESAINDVVFAGLAVVFLVTVPSRLRRRRALASLHRLRSFAHVIDMHQLAKDPDRFRADYVPTEATPVSDLTVAEMARYLEYCSELLSLLAKVAALLAQESADPVVLDGVAEIESLTLGMSRKIWQKISLVGRA